MSGSPVLLAARSTATSEDTALVRRGPHPKKALQQRRYAPKTRTGCLTCKIRRVKCDEAQPACNRCTSTGRKCDGYVSPGELSPKEEVAPLTVALVNDVSTDALERRTFDFFRTKTAPAVSGYFQDSVWDRIVLQMSHSEPAVRYAVNALGAMHEERYLRTKASRDGHDVAPFRTDFPVQQYVKSLNEMQILLQDKSSSLDTILLCSLLFSHFESLRESFMPALMHCENAISLLYEQSAKFDPRKVNPSLVRAMMRIDLQATLYLTMRTPGLTFYTAAMDSILPHSFRDLTHARDLVNSWTGRLYHFIRTVADNYKYGSLEGIPLEEFAKAQELERTMIELERLLWDFMHKPTSRLTAREQLGLGMLRSHTIINRIFAATCLQTESSFDRFLPEFEDVLTICLHILSSDVEHRAAPGGTPHEHDDVAARRLLTVSLDEGLIRPLCEIANNCRDSRVRRRALEALRRLPIGEGNWHIETTIRTCEMCIEYEERQSTREYPSCEDVPEWSRVHGMSFDGWEVHDGRRMVKVQFRTRPNGVDGEWVNYDEVIDCVSPVNPSIGAPCAGLTGSEIRDHIVNRRKPRCLELIEPRLRSDRTSNTSFFSPVDEKE